MTNPAPPFYLFGLIFSALLSTSLFGCCSALTSLPVAYLLKMWMWTCVHMYLNFSDYTFPQIVCQIYSSYFVFTEV